MSASLRRCWSCYGAGAGRRRPRSLFRMFSPSRGPVEGRSFFLWGRGGEGVDELLSTVCKHSTK